MKSPAVSLLVFASIIARSGAAAQESVALKVAPGFIAEEIVAGRDGGGSWSAMTVKRADASPAIAIANEGGNVGPDLTAVACKLGPRELLESLIKPLKVIADPYQNTIIELANGEALVGRIIEKGKGAKSKGSVILAANPLTDDREEIPKDKIHGMNASPISPMPEGLLNIFAQDEILDLLACLGFGPG
jgi:putative heme-binding domain-containing protein